MSTKELIEGSVSIFGRNKDLKKLHATSDGQYFLEENRANLHKNSKRDPITGKDKLTVVPITREDALATLPKKATPTASVKSEFLQKSVADIKEALKTADDVEALKVVLAEEKANEPRSTAIEAIEAKIVELEKAAQ
jgi:hypothetical protein